MLTCEEIREHGMAERYLARALASEDEEAFEAHYFQCERCQQEIELGLTIRRALHREVAGPSEGALPLRRQESRKRWQRMAWGSGALAAAAGLVALLIARSSVSDTSLVPLGRVLEPPVYLGLAVRASQDSADTLFATAMDAYLARDYRATVVRLRAALEAGVEPAAAEFFLASSLLMLDRSEEAALAYGRVITFGRTPYLREAHFYRAKVLVRLGRAREALTELSSVAGNDALGQEARTITARIQELRIR